MATITLAEAELLKAAHTIPLSYCFDDHGIAEPVFDYNEDGEAVDFGIDAEPAEVILPGASSSTELLGVSPSEFAETAIRIPEAGRIADFSFKGREYLRKVYDTPANKVLLVFGRQTEKTTTLGNRMLCYSALVSNFRSLYVAPSAEQAKVFSNDRIKDAIDASPLLRAYTSSSINQAVFFKKFINYSQIRLRYAYLTADRVRGIASDQILIDAHFTLSTRCSCIRVRLSP
jgi:hypothetical protein